MGFQKDSILAISLFDGLPGDVVSDRDGIEVLMHSYKVRLLGNLSRLVHLTAVKAEEPCQVAGVADIHGIGYAVLAGPDGLVDARLHKTRKFIVLVRRHHKLMHGKAHLHGNKPSHEVAEVAAGH